MRATDPPRCVCVWGWGVGWGGGACVGACTETCEHVCVCTLGVSASAGACARVQATQSMSAGCFMFQCASVSLCFV